MVDIEQIKKKVLLKYPFFARALPGVKIIESDKISTLCTDGGSIFYNAEFLEGLDSSQQMFAFAHEICHIAFNHILRAENRDRQTWNIATDAVINQILKKDGLKMPGEGIDFDWAKDMDAESVYQKLIEEQENQQQNGGSFNQNGEGDSAEKENENPLGENSGGHDLWEESVKNYKAGKGLKSNFEEEKQKQAENENPQSNSDAQRVQAAEDIAKNGEQKAFEQNKILRKKQLEDLAEQLAKQALDAGREGSGVFKSIDDIGSAKPLITWQRYLKETAKLNADWSFKDAEFENGVLNARITKFQVPETEIMLDVSGSVSESLLKNFLRECKNIFAVSKIKVGQFNTSATPFQEIKSVKDIDKMKFNIGGGTDFDVAVKAFSKRAANKIIFTDGEAEMPREKVNAIWVAFGDRKINPPGGKVIYIDARALAKLKDRQVVR